MKKIFYNTLTIILLVSIAVPCLSQNIRKVHGRGEYIVSSNDHTTFVQAKESCELEAKINAIKAAFGEKISSTNEITEIDDGRFISPTMRFEMSTSSMGDWIKKTRPTSFSVNLEGDKLIFSAEVWGEAREIIQAKPEFTWKVLAGGSNDSYENNRFNNNDRIFVSFRAPSNGYVAIYVWHCDDEVDCLMPYKSDHYKVDGGKKYVFFDEQSDPKLPAYQMETEHKLEVNQIILVYSPKSFNKCDDYSTDFRHPNSLTYTAFESWLGNCMRADNKMVVVKKWITIYNINGK